MYVLHEKPTKRELTMKKTTKELIAQLDEEIEIYNDRIHEYFAYNNYMQNMLEYTDGEYDQVLKYIDIIYHNEDKIYELTKELKVVEKQLHDITEVL